MVCEGPFRTEGEALSAATMKDDVSMADVTIRCYPTRNMATAKSLRKREIADERSSFTVGLQPMRSTAHDLEEGLE